MYSQSSMDHIVRDLIMCWQWTIKAVVAMAVGLIIWLSFFFQADIEEPGRSDASSEVMESVSESSLKTVSLFQKKRVPHDSSVTVFTDSVHSERRQQADPLARSIEVSAVHSNDFRVRIIPLSIPVFKSNDDNDASSTKKHLSPSFRSGTNE